MTEVRIDQLRAILSRWSQRVREELRAPAVYCFGSVVYRSGEQFTQASDVDLVVLMPAIPDAIDRADWLEACRRLKCDLEQHLAKFLRRPRDGAAICSVVAITPDELAADIHKGGAAAFFSDNQFFDLETGEVNKGLPGAGDRPISEQLVTECLKFAQGLRNQYLAINAAGASCLGDFDDPNDAAPKATMRHAAMVRFLEDTGDGDPGEKFDLDIGADRITVAIDARRGQLDDLDRRYSSRRGGRAESAALSSKDQLVLSELIFDMAVQMEAKAARAKDEQKKPNRLGAHSTVFFAKRFGDAFPGVRGIDWFDDLGDIKMRLAALLADPLQFDNATPIWWSRGGANLPISSFGVVGDIIRINEGDMNIVRVAVVNRGSYKYNFVYVAVDSLPAIGIYDNTAQRIEEVRDGTSPMTYYWEEYGVVDGEHLITRAELDDGSAVIDGALQSIVDRAELRSRYVTPYNFVIAAAGAPLLRPDYDRGLEDHLNAMLKGEDRLAQIAEEAGRLPTGNF